MVINVVLLLDELYAVPSKAIRLGIPEPEIESVRWLQANLLGPPLVPFPSRGKALIGIQDKYGYAVVANLMSQVHGTRDILVGCLDEETAIPFSFIAIIETSRYPSYQLLEYHFFGAKSTVTLVQSHGGTLQYNASCALRKEASRNPLRETRQDSRSG